MIDVDRILRFVFVIGLCVRSFANSAYLTAVDATITTTWGPGGTGYPDALHLIDGSGLDVDSPAGLHAAEDGAAAMWHSDGGGASNCYHIVLTQQPISGVTVEITAMPSEPVIRLNDGLPGEPVTLVFPVKRNGTG